MLTFVISLAIACFVGLVVLGHVLLLQALLSNADRAGGKREHRKSRGILPRLPV
jgi:hypothetical protein